MSNNTTEFYFPWSCSSNSEFGTHTLQQVVHEFHTNIPIHSVKYLLMF